MKRVRQLRVKTGLVVPSREGFFGIKRDVATKLTGPYIDASGLSVVQSINTMPLVPLNACPNGGCGHCWYCRKSQGAEW